MCRRLGCVGDESAETIRAAREPFRKWSRGHRLFSAGTCACACASQLRRRKDGSAETGTAAGQACLSSSCDGLVWKGHQAYEYFQGVWMEMAHCKRCKAFCKRDTRGL
jgi:hypothetical protein